MKPILFAVLAGLCWGIGEVATKQVLQSRQVGVMTVVCLRILGEAPFALLLYFLIHKVLHTDGEPAAWWMADRPVLLKLFFGTAMMAGFAGVAFYYLGLKYGQVSVVKPIAFTIAPAIGAALAWLVLKEPMPAQKVVGILIIVTGVAVLSTTRAPHAAAGAAPQPAVGSTP
ncbi:MAG: DMT family transporter [Phycisphaerales bacterium]